MVVMSVLVYVYVVSWLVSVRAVGGSFVCDGPFCWSCVSSVFSPGGVKVV